MSQFLHDDEANALAIPRVFSENSRANNKDCGVKFSSISQTGIYILDRARLIFYLKFFCESQLTGSIVTDCRLALCTCFTQTCIYTYKPITTQCHISTLEKTL